MHRCLGRWRGCRSGTCLILSHKSSSTQHGRLRRQGSWMHRCLGLWRGQQSGVWATSMPRTLPIPPGHLRQATRVSHCSTHWRGRQTRQVGDFNAQDLANTAWAFANRPVGRGIGENSRAIHERLHGTAARRTAARQHGMGASGGWTGPVVHCVAKGVGQTQKMDM